MHYDPSTRRAYENGFVNLLAQIVHAAGHGHFTNEDTHPSFALLFLTIHGIGTARPRSRVMRRHSQRLVPGSKCT
jgi:hypothetical protein